MESCLEMAGSEWSMEQMSECRVSRSIIVVAREYRSVEYGCSEGGCKLLVSEHWSKIIVVKTIYKISNKIPKIPDKIIHIL